MGSNPTLSTPFAGSSSFCPSAHSTYCNCSVEYAALLFRSSRNEGPRGPMPVYSSRRQETSSSDGVGGYGGRRLHTSVVDVYHKCPCTYDSQKLFRAVLEVGSVFYALPGTDPLVERVLHKSHLRDKIRIFLQIGGHSSSGQYDLYVIRASFQRLYQFL